MRQFRVLLTIRRLTDENLTAHQLKKAIEAAVGATGGVKIIDFDETTFKADKS